MKKILIIAITLLLWFTASLSAQKYCGDIHEYLFEQGVELLNEYKYYSEFQAGNPLYNLMKEGSSAEDEMDWVYGYSEVGGPEIDISGVDDLTEWLLESYCKTITHFWDADTFDVFETEGHDLVSGFAFGDEFTIHDVQSAITKAYTTLFGYNNEVHFKGFKFDAGCEQMFLTEVGTGIQWGFYSPLQYFDISIESIDDYILNGQAYVSGWYDIGNNLIKYTDPIHVEFSETNYFGEIFRQQHPNLEYSYVGRIIHLIGDMAVPAHVHRDQHPPMPYWVNLNLYWDWDYCDGYEGWDYNEGPIGPTGEGGYLRNRVWLIEDWDAESILENYGGLIAIPSECNGENFIFDLFYSINQVTDVIASDDKPGDWDLHPDHPLGAYPFIEDMFDRLQDSSLYPYFSTGTLQLLMDPHEKWLVNYECDKIRDVCIPLAIRGTASFLEWWAKWNDFTPTWVSYREICCQIIIYSYSGAILPLPDNIKEALEAAATNQKLESNSDDMF
ncbi:MAG: hypothetical protein U9R21_07895 [Candidatus Thermoplasmatota archaeon]|nr:hypothetical protein [Candidatus Thermoplasmatota archaeon]